MESLGLLSYSRPVVSGVVGTGLVSGRGLLQEGKSWKAPYTPDQLKKLKEDLLSKQGTATTSQDPSFKPVAPVR